MRFVDDQHGDAASFGCFAGEHVVGLGGQRGGAVGGPAAEAGDDVVVDSADAGGGVADVDDGVPGRVDAGQGGAGGDGLAGADLAGDDAEVFSVMVQVMRAAAWAWAACRCSRAGARSRPNGIWLNPGSAAGSCRSWIVLPAGGCGVAVDGGELLLRGVEVAGQRGGAAAGVVEEDDGGVHGVRGVLAEIVAEAAGGQRPVEVGGDLDEQLRQPGSAQGQGSEDVVGGRWLAQAGVAAVAQFRPRMASAAVRARSMVSSLVSSSKLIIWRKSSTRLLLLAGAGAAGAVRAGGAAIVRVVDEGGVVDLRLQLGAVGGIEDPQVVDPGGLRLGALPAVAGAGLGVPVAADDERDGLARGLALVPHLDTGQVEGGRRSAR
jgi:hypothetical protein